MNTEDIAQLHAQYPNEIKRLYAEFGIKNAPLKIQTTLDLLTVYKGDFERLLKEAVGMDSFVGGIIGKAAGLVGSGKIKGAIQGFKGGVPTETAPPPPEAKKIMGLDQGLFIGLCVLLLVLLVYAAIKYNA